jgi:zinc transporter ZupT
VADRHRRVCRQRRGRLRRARPHPRTDRAAAQAFAAGALLTMIADTMLPEAFEVEGPYTGSLVAIGFALSLLLAAI